ncbi:MAG: hypothetical protein WC189_03695 [Bacilli bacterium]
MKRFIKTSLIIFIILLSIIMIDIVQAKVFSNSPILSKRYTLQDKDSYVDKGFLTDTYYCVKEKDIVTVKWYFKLNKFTCPIE